MADPSHLEASLLEKALHALPIPFGIYTPVKDKDGNLEDLQIDFVNEAACQNTQIPPEEQVGKRLNELYPMRDARLQAAYSEVLETGDPMSVESVLTIDPLTGEKTRIVYDIDIARLDSKIVIHWKDVTESKEMDLNALRAAERDDLTGLLSPASFYLRLEGALADTMRYGTDIAVLIVDLDGFKKINDVYGHLFGNKVLQAVSGLMHERVRDSDTLARFGGDEFVALLNHATAKEAEAVANEIRRSINRFNFQGNGNIKLRASVGIYPVKGFTEIDADAVLRLADQALYKAKRLGGDRTEKSHGESVTPEGSFQGLF